VVVLVVRDEGNVWWCRDVVWGVAKERQRAPRIRTVDYPGRCRMR
jgi:hypothetical protein